VLQPSRGEEGLEELYRILWRFSRDVVNIVKENYGEIGEAKTLWIRRRVVGIEYGESSISYEYSLEPFEGAEPCSQLTLYSKLISQLMTLPVCVDTYKYISKICKVGESQAQSWLRMFIFRLLMRLLNRHLSEEELNELIKLFIDDLEEKPVIWSVAAWLKGLWLKDEEIEIGEGLRIRRPKPEDLTLELPIHEAFIVPIETECPPAILEVMLKASDDLSALNELIKLTIALRLYKPCSICPTKVMLKPKSILRSSETRELFPASIVYPCSLSLEEASTLKVFLDRVMKWIPVIQGHVGLIDYVSIALKRYDEALFCSDPVERLTQAVMGLEVLYLKSSERMELARRLAQRVARCISIYGYDVLNVFEVVKEAYNIRSMFVHGAPIELKEHRKIIELANEMVRYLQMSVLMFLELKSYANIEKCHFLDIVDRSLLSLKVQEYLEKLIRDNCLATASLANASKGIRVT
jgi:hypothetical protein